MTEPLLHEQVPHDYGWVFICRFCRYDIERLDMRNECPARLRAEVDRLTGDKAAIVADLRARANELRTLGVNPSYATIAWALDDSADRYERGDYLTKTQRDT